MVNTIIKAVCRMSPVLLAAILLLATPAADNAIAEGGKTECDYRQYLDDPAVRVQYLDMKSEMELIARIRSENMAQGSPPSAFPPIDNTRELDDHSKECISCHSHKGSSASDDINDPKHAGMLAISATHGIGTDYIAASKERTNLKRVEELPSGMTLVNGRIACITCHNPLNPQPNNLAVDTRGSALCFACHRF